MTASDIHARIREARIAAGFSNPTEAINAFGWTASTYYGYENGDREPSKKMAEKISLAFRVSLDWLLTGNGEMRRTTAPTMKRRSALDEQAETPDCDGDDTSSLSDSDRIQVEIGVLRRQLVGSLGFAGIDEKQVRPIVDRVIASLAKPASRSVVHLITGDAHISPVSPGSKIFSQR